MAFLNFYLVALYSCTSTLHFNSKSIYISHLYEDEFYSIIQLLSSMNIFIGHKNTLSKWAFMVNLKSLVQLLLSPMYKKHWYRHMVSWPKAIHYRFQPLVQYRQVLYWVLHKPLKIFMCLYNLTKIVREW